MKELARLGIAQKEQKSESVYEFSELQFKAAQEKEAALRNKFYLELEKRYSWRCWRGSRLRSSGSGRTLTVPIFYKVLQPIEEAQFREIVAGKEKKVLSFEADEVL